MARNIIETIMGAVVLIVAIGFLMFAYRQSAIKEVDGYRLYATFTDISGISPGSDVRVGGLKVGVVESLELDPKTFQASVLMEIKKDVQLPKDSSAAVASSGLLGDKFIKLDPGGDDATLKEDDVIRFTQSSVSLEEMIGKFVFSGGGVSSGGDAGSSDASSAKPDEGEKKNNPFSLGL